jgi:hypothetical protein
MALSDLLWACPRCGTDRGIDDEGVCRACGTRFRRGPGAEIVATDPNGRDTVRPAWEWVNDLPDPSALFDADPAGACRTAHASGRTVEADSSVFGETGYLNRVERFGDPRPVDLTLHRDRLVLAWEGEGETEVVPLEQVTAVQASSSKLQIKARGRPLVMFRLADDSVYLWELLLHAALRDFYGRTGRGEIMEFQPRISVR